MRILANYGAKANGDSYSITFETIGDVPAAQAPATVDELFRLAREAVQRQIGNSHAPAVPAVEDPAPVSRSGQSRAEGSVARTSGGGRKPVIKDPFQPVSSKQLRLLRQLAQQKGAWVEGLEDLTMGEASEKIDELMALAA